MAGAFKTVNGTEIYVFPALSGIPGLVHAVSTRVGGVSSGCFSSLNLSFSRGDDDANVIENFRRFSFAAGIKPESLVLSKHVHGDTVLRVGAEEAGKFLQGQRNLVADALITNEPGVTLCKTIADCVGIMMYDAKNRAIADVHAGWRGTVLGIAGKAVRAMGEAFGTDPSDIIACISPSIGPCCFEVGADVAERFTDIYGDGVIAERLAGGKAKVDLWKANTDDLVKAGVPSGNISAAGQCTKCNEDKFFSHRRNGENRGGMIAVIGLTK